ncbi:MAG: sulfatase-like hydrolase/transferase [Verrucomicrobia bacterium]|nr:sulfatase-like hydrolase/transferase [Verrucomicrobiota bacterium]
MNHRIHSMKAILSLALSLAFSLPILAAAETKRPNLVIILADDMGYADIGAHGCQDIPTPNIDSLAKDGVRFTDAYANGSFCTPTRAALMSGRYQHRSGMEDLSNVSGPLPKAVTTLPDRLRAAGYTTGMAGKWHLGDQAGFTPVDRGFDEFFGFTGGGHIYVPKANSKGEYAAPILRNREPVKESRYLTDAFGEEAAAFVGRQRGATKPFFLYLAFNAVHTPLEATEKYLQRFPNITEPKRRTYAAMLSAMDDAVGLVLAKLDAIGQRDNTLVFFTSDNGGPTTRNAVNGSRNTPLRGSKCETFEGGIRVPLLARWPGVLAAGAVYRQPVISFDLAATTLALAGADAKGVEGVDLIPFLTAKKSGAPHDVLFWRNRTRSNNYGARQGDWKFVHSTEGDAEPGPKQTPARDMLFNLASDIGEQRDLAAQHPDKLAALKQLYETWSDEVDADCRKLGIEPMMPKTAPGAKAAPKRKKTKQ